MNNNLFSWDVKRQIGFYPVKDTWYNDRYFETSIENSRSLIAKALNEFRAKIVNKYVKGKVLDFGIGCGAFLGYRDNCLGFDICPKSIKWLKEKGLFFDFYRRNLDKQNIEGITFFDVLEHVRYPETILKCINGQHIFMSLPIFRDKNHILKSKHFKINEHFWYFTDYSLIEFMNTYGFRLLERTDEETRIGREDIWTYVFKKASCKSCFWFDWPRVPYDKERYGDSGICHNITSEKGIVNPDDLVCEDFKNL